MRSLPRRPMAVLAGAVGTLLVVGVGSTPAPQVAAATRPVEVSPTGEYLVQLAPGATQRAATAQHVESTGVQLEEVSGTLHVSLATLTPEEAAVLAATPGVVAVEPNHEVHALGTQPDPPWGLDRTDQTDLPLDSSYGYSSAAGAGVDIYVIDSGVNAAHVEFTGRLAQGINMVGAGAPNTNTNDCQGHGTHVSGTAAGTTYGVAKLATIVPVRVLDCGGNGYDSDVLDAFEWVIARHTSGRAVVNLSIGGSASQIIDNAIAALVDDGIAVAVAAGNDGTNACFDSPARAPEALTVGAISSDDAGAYFTNYGACVDLFAPGVSIPSAGIGSTTAQQHMNGTSMASPHVAGALAVLWADHPMLTAAQVMQMLLLDATAGRLTNIGAGSPNLLLHLDASTDPVDPIDPVDPPVDPPADPPLVLTAAAAVVPAARCTYDPDC